MGEGVPAFEQLGNLFPFAAVFAMSFEKHFVLFVGPFVVGYCGVEVVVPSTIGETLPFSTLLSGSFLRTSEGELLRNESPVLHAVLLDYLDESIIFLN
jgi:hypothetical protein